MVELSRYNVSEDFADIKGGVLINKLGITDQKLLSDMETVLLHDAYTFYLTVLGKNKLEFDVDLIFELHRYFLGTLYEWAGKIREVDISKGGTLFIPAKYISNALKELERIIVKNISFKNKNRLVVAENLAEIACEFNAVHPFREGNGRTIRLFIDLLLLANGYKMFNYNKLNENVYIEACRAGMEKNYKKMKNIFLKNLERIE